MRMAFVVLIGWLMVTGGTAAEEPNLRTRYDISVDTDDFPQKTPKDTLDSVIKAIQLKKIDYLLAQLSDPAFVDQRVKEVHGGKFAGLVQETTTKLIDDPETIQQLRRFLKEGGWQDGEESASVKLKNSRDRVFFKKIGERWFLENRKMSEK